ncbi:sensor histidine kinase [Paenibacillus timonensis]|uniref:histidine kinase n=1 Tax=Paenibacillus timonensis TaxID=225915 RepID=A0ABW3SIB1_9BACL|nr:sensor histidine kinase [Paenibacillus timonensis]MCH1642285.1 sensor histidine kinase [Paenibacillus timonensis]
MRLFWKEQVPLLLFLVPQILLVPFLFWLAGVRQTEIAVYGLLLSFTLLLLYLIYRYFSNREVYRRMTEPPRTLEELLQPAGETPLALALHELLESGYRLYEAELYRYGKQREHQTAFTGRWVHQMKTPISVIQLTLENEREQETIPETVLDSIQEELDRLRKGLEMALYTSRLEQFEHDFHVAPIPLLAAVNEAVAEHRKLFIRKGVYPDIRIGEELVAYSDKKWLTFVLGQLITNAVNYSSGVGDKVVFTAYVRGKKTVLDVRDYGIGILTEDIRRVFEPYYTGQRGRQYSESTGMGLYLVREVCSRLGHRVELESAPGQGTTVRLLFERQPV